MGRKFCSAIVFCIARYEDKERIEILNEMKDSLSERSIQNENTLRKETQSKESVSVSYPSMNAEVWV